jgi:hypothetical protein
VTAGDDLAGLAAAMEAERRIPAGAGERFTVYAALGVAFASGHVLAMRRVPASPIGGAYTSVWLRDPAGRWVVFSDRPPEEACPRYFGRALSQALVAPIVLRWSGPRRLELEVASARLTWTMDLEATRTTRVLNRVAALLPAGLWYRAWFLALMGRLAGRLLGTGRLGLAGRVPNGQRFLAVPKQVWMVARSQVRLDGRDLGPMQPLRAPIRLADFWIPGRGLFAMGETAFEVPVPAAETIAIAHRTSLIMEGRGR